MDLLSCSNLEYVCDVWKIVVRHREVKMHPNGANLTLFDVIAKKSTCFPLHGVVMDTAGQIITWQSLDDDAIDGKGRVYRDSIIFSREFGYSDSHYNRWARTTPYCERSTRIGQQAMRLRPGLRPDLASEFGVSVQQETGSNCSEHASSGGGPDLADDCYFMDSTETDKFPSVDDCFLTLSMPPLLRQDNSNRSFYCAKSSSRLEPRSNNPGFTAANPSLGNHRTVSCANITSMCPALDDVLIDTWNHCQRTSVIDRNSSEPPNSVSVSLIPTNSKVDDSGSAASAVMTTNSDEMTTKGAGKRLPDRQSLSEFFHLTGSVSIPSKARTTNLDDLKVEGNSSTSTTVKNHKSRYNQQALAGGLSMTNVRPRQTKNYPVHKKEEQSTAKRLPPLSLASLL